MGGERHSKSLVRLGYPQVATHIGGLFHDGALVAQFQFSHYRQSAVESMAFVPWTWGLCEPWCALGLLHLEDTLIESARGGLQGP